MVAQVRRRMDGSGEKPAAGGIVKHLIDNSQIQAVIAEMKSINPAITWFPMLFLNNAPKGEYITPYPSGTSNNLYGKWDLHKEVLSFWSAVWWQGTGLQVSPVIACGDDPNDFNTPTTNWKRFVNDLGTWYKNELSPKYPNSYHSVFASWEAEKLYGKDVGKLQQAVDVCKAAFPNTPIWVHLTDPDLVKGLKVDVIAIQSPKDPFHGDQLSDSDLVNWVNAFAGNTNVPIHFLECTGPWASKYVHQREVVRNTGKTIGVGW